MPWDLEIHTIDVGQGDSSLIVARDTTAAGNDRTLLIDGGHSDCAAVVHDYLVGVNLTLDQIVVTNYDIDHAAGVQALLNADNYSLICDVIATEVAAQPTTGAREDQVAGFAAAVTAVLAGAYGTQAGQVAAYVGAARTGVPGGATDAAAARFGSNLVIGNPPHPAESQLFTSTKILYQHARTIAVAAANSVAVAGVLGDDAYAAALAAFATSIPPTSRFDTGGWYADTDVIDLNDSVTYDARAGYDAVVNGTCRMNGGAGVDSPNVNRGRLPLPALGDEILWDSGPGAGPAPAGAPMVFLVAARQHLWPGGTLFPPSGQTGNDQSIGLILRFGRFFWWSGGDLPTQGEFPLQASVRATGLPDPAGPVGATFPPAQSYGGFKCGHHGAQSSTDPTFVAAVTPGGAVFSCGTNSYGHPRQPPIDALHFAGTVDHFYLTNCRGARPHVPMSTGAHQLTVPGNKSRVSGDNVGMGGLHVNRGNVITRVTHAASVMAMPGPGRTYTVEYWEQNPPIVPPAAAPVPGMRVDTLHF